MQCKNWSDSCVIDFPSVTQQFVHLTSVHFGFHFPVAIFQTFNPSHIMIWPKILKARILSYPIKDADKHKIPLDCFCSIVSFLGWMIYVCVCHRVCVCEREREREREREFTVHYKLLRNIQQYQWTFWLRNISLERVPSDFVKFRKYRTWIILARVYSLLSWI